LEEASLEPAPLRTLIADWLRQPGGHFVSGEAWTGADIVGALP